MLTFKHTHMHYSAETHQVIAISFDSVSMAKNGNHYTGASVSAHVTNVSCSGSESQLTDCTYTILSGASCSVDVAGVECQSESCSELQLRDSGVGGFH